MVSGRDEQRRTRIARVTESADETAAVGRRLGRELARKFGHAFGDGGEDVRTGTAPAPAPDARPAAGVVIHLLGDLGAGKTVFVRGLAEGLAIDPDEVSSPTFTLIQEYAGRPPLFHVDLYRLAGAEVGDLGLDALAAEGIVAIEWANRLPESDPRAIVVEIEDAGGDRRRITIDVPAGVSELDVGDQED